MRHPRLVAVTALMVLVVVTACSGGGAQPGPPGTSTSAPDVVRSPLTGEVVSALPDRPIYAVKIENTSAGEPQLGLSDADLVVEELVEGGLTRLAALYSSELPRTVGHVRSVRATDADIALPVGARVVASGGAPQTYDVLRRARVTVDAQDRGAKGFRDDRSKQAPYNRLVDLRTLAEGVEPSRVPGPYLRWAKSSDQATVPRGKKATAASVRFSGAATTQWAFRSGSWVRTNGHAREEFQAATLLVLFAPVGDAGYTDPAGNPVPVTRFRGSGRAVVLAGDSVVEARWSKRRARSTIELSTRGGRQITLPPGRTWIELSPADGGSVSAR